MEQIHNNNRENLKLLSIFHYVVEGIVAATSMFSLLHIDIGLYFILSPSELPQSDGASPPPIPGFGWMFFIGGLAF